MSRKQTYFCDTCQNEFGDKSHINLEIFSMRIAYKAVTGWKTNSLRGKHNQYHFCSILCINDWIATRIEGLNQQIGGEYGVPANERHPQT